jgi:GNAT superfamily N-acetyltransferase
LFVHPDFESKGIGRLLHDTMLKWYFKNSIDTIWLGTEPDTRAANFYTKAGWKEVGANGNNEIKFEMTSAEWLNLQVN